MAVLVKLALVQAVFTHFADFGLTIWLASGLFSLATGTVMTKVLCRTQWRRAAAAWGVAALSWVGMALVAKALNHDLTRLF